jgi:hypothetical protein
MVLVGSPGPSERGGSGRIHNAPAAGITSKIRGRAFLDWIDPRFTEMASFKEYDFAPQNLPEKLLAAIGYMTTSAAQTESIVEMAIHCFLDIDVEYGKAITTHMAMPLRFSALRAAAEIRIDDLDVLDTLDEVLEKVEEAFKKRNAVVHHTWCRDPESNEIFTVKDTARTSVRTDLIPMTIQAVEEDAFFVYEAGMALMSFLQTYGFRLKFPPANRYRGHKSEAARKKREEAKLRKK